MYTLKKFDCVSVVIVVVMLIAAVVSLRIVIRSAAREKQETREQQPDILPVYLVDKSDPIGGVWPGAREALNLLQLHESLEGKRMVGDGGLARGWLHQHEAHWREGCAMLGVAWPWPADTSDLDKCEYVAVGYWMRYARRYLDEGDVEELIRRFRLPNTPHRADNDRYLQKVLEKGR